MHTMPETEVFVTVGVDTHKDIHVAVALDQLGRILDKVEIPTTAAGYAELLAWASDLGTIDKVGIEGTGSHGAGLCRWLTARGVIVVEVDRPDRRLRPNKGKSDTIDAESAARKVLSDEATAIPKAQDGNVKMIRILRLTRRSALVAQGQASNQMHALISTAPDELRAQLRDLTTRKRVAKAARFRPDRQSDPILATTKLALKKLARRFLELDAEIKELSRKLDQLVEANAALHMIAVNRLANGHEPTRAYVRKRSGGTKADLDTLRCIKRYIAREVFPLLRDAVTHRPDAVPRAA